MNTAPLSYDLLNPQLDDSLRTVLPSDISAKEPVPDFQQLLKTAIDKVNEIQQDASERMHNVDSGESQDLLGTMLATQKSGLTFQALIQVRNKAVSAYEEIMRMQM